MTFLKGPCCSVRALLDPLTVLISSTELLYVQQAWGRIALHPLLGNRKDGCFLWKLSLHSGEWMSSSRELIIPTAVSSPTATEFQASSQLWSAVMCLWPAQICTPGLWCSYHTCSSLLSYLNGAAWSSPTLDHLLLHHWKSAFPTCCVFVPNGFYK